jgi:hypothetical protein
MHGFSAPFVVAPIIHDFCIRNGRVTPIHGIENLNLEMDVAAKLARI